MSATNSTTHYKFPIFEPADKPTWLGDWNSAMNALDEAIYQASQTGSGESATAKEALAKATEALQTANSALETASSANSTSSTANSTASSALAKAGTNEANITKLSGDISSMQTAINTAQQNIITLQQGLTATDSKASTASTNASTALSTANQAKTTADSASSTASAANTKATNAQSTASSAQTAVNNLSLRVSSLEGQVSSDPPVIAPLGVTNPPPFPCYAKITPLADTASGFNYLLEFWYKYPMGGSNERWLYFVFSPPTQWNLPRNISQTSNVYVFHEAGFGRGNLSINRSNGAQITIEIEIPLTVNTGDLIDGFSSTVLNGDFIPISIS